MHFWFLKQIYYYLKRFIKNKLFILILFIIIFLLFLYNSSFAVSDLSYTPLLYIQSTGTQYIDTGFAPTSNSKVVIDYQLVNLQSYDEYGIRFFGLGAIGPGTPLPSRFALGVSNNNEFYYGIGDVNINKSLNISLTDRVTSFIDLSTGTYGTNDYTYDLYDINYSNPNNLSAYLFARRGTYNAVEGLCNIKIYEVKLYDNNTLIKHFIPCRLNSTNEIGMWDTVNNQFYSNNGTGTFIASDNAIPYITNSSNDIIKWTFNNLTINCANINPNSKFWLIYNYGSSTFELDITNYLSIYDNTAIINVPKSDISEGIVLRNGSSIDFSLQVRTPDLQVLYYNLGSYTLNLTTDEENNINDDSNKQLLSDISKNQQETTNAINNLDNTITDSNVEDDSIFLPSDNTNDITADGLNNIFSNMYNAFCTGEAQDIVFPIPFTNKNITLEADYVRQMLINSNSNWIITIIEAFWWYLISSFIIKDISSKITKIKSGNIENIQNSNIKEEML